MTSFQQRLMQKYPMKKYPSYDTRYKSFPNYLGTKMNHRQKESNHALVNLERRNHRRRESSRPNPLFNLEEIESSRLIIISALRHADELKQQKTQLLMLNPSVIEHRSSLEKLEAKPTRSINIGEFYRSCLDNSIVITHADTTPWVSESTKHSQSQDQSTDTVSTPVTKVISKDLRPEITITQQPSPSGTESSIGVGGFCFEQRELSNYEAKWFNDLGLDQHDFNLLGSSLFGRASARMQMWDLLLTAIHDGWEVHGREQKLSDIGDMSTLVIRLYHQSHSIDTQDLECENVSSGLLKMLKVIFHIEITILNPENNESNFRGSDLVSKHQSIVKTDTSTPAIYSAKHDSSSSINNYAHTDKTKSRVSKQIVPNPKMYILIDSRSNQKGGSIKLLFRRPHKFQCLDDNRDVFSNIPIPGTVFDGHINTFPEFRTKSDT